MNDAPRLPPVPQAIIDTPYDHEGTPGRMCTGCNSAWPATEPDGEPWHHSEDCEAAS